MTTSGSHTRKGPFLLGLAHEQTPIRLAEEPLLYDSERQLSVRAADPIGLPAVMNPDVGVLLTKKDDREKGEDQKDRWMPAMRRG